MALAFALGAAHAGAADEVETLHARLRGGVDFRVRALAALAMGKMRGPEVVAPLVAALDDAHPAVRTAAAAALALLGADAKPALPALAAHALTETEPSTKAEIDRAVAVIQGRRPGDYAPAAVVIRVGKIGSVEASGADEVVDAVRSALGARAAAGVGGEGRVSTNRRPVVEVDGRVLHVDEEARDGAMHVGVTVELALRRWPQSQIVGTLSGFAEASGPVDDPPAREVVAALRRRAATRAVESALAGVSPAVDRSSR